MQSVLLVEDSTDCQQLVSRSLGKNMEIEWAQSLAEATKRLKERNYDLILLDVMLPDGDGFRLCSLLQAHERLHDTPVIFLTARNSVSDKVLGFSIGADDYIPKPFDPMELKARVEAKLRKKLKAFEESDILHLGELEVNRANQKVYFERPDSDTKEKEEVELTPIEFKLLMFLAKDTNKIRTRDEILDAVWGENIHVYARSVDTHVSKLRRKLGPMCDYVQSVHGSGYRLQVKEQEQGTELDVAPHLLPS